MTSVVLFDGVCNLCNGAINFIIDRDPGAHFQFAPLQSAQARDLLPGHALPDERDGNAEPDSIVLVEGGAIYQQSTAVLRIARRLRWPWSWAYGAIMFPRPLRDFVYRWIARHRYRWFGRSETCRVPTPERRARFLT